MSGPNSLVVLSDGASDHFFLTWDTADTNAGAVQVSASFNAAAISGTQAGGVFARGASDPVTFAAGTAYWGLLDIGTHTLTCYKMVGGALTSIGAVTISASLSTDVWYTVLLSCVSTAIKVSVQRSSDNYHLNGSGGWQAIATTAISATDSGISGSGYAGLTLCATDSNLYSDEFTLATDDGLGGGG